MNYLLDTCVLSELVRKEPEPAVVEWIRQQDEETLYLSALSLGEIQKGIVRLPDSKRRTGLQEWLDEDLQERFAGRVLEISLQVALTWGRLQGKADQRGRTMSVIDGLLAATALSSGAAVVTRNEKDFEPSGVTIVNPWSEQSS